MNLKQLAEHLGLSQTTVSRALNGFPEVGEKTRLRVAEAAERFQYQPNASARKLATGRAGAIGIVFASEASLLHDPVFTDFLGGLAARAARSQTDVLVSSSSSDPGETYRRLARIRSVDAVVLSLPMVDDPRLALLNRLGLPALVHGRSETEASFAYVDIDNEGAFAHAADLFLDLGHSRIGLINGERRYTFAAYRSKGWRKAITARGLAAPDVYDCSGPMTEEAGYRMARRLLDSEAPPTALLCSSMFQALGAMRAARDCGLVIGQDLSLIAHDDGLAAIRPETLSPPVTTTYSSIRRAGERLAEIAEHVVEGADPSAHREIWEVDLVFRRSAVSPG